mgnify:CR=1 FL=1
MNFGTETFYEEQDGKITKFHKIGDYDYVKLSARTVSPLFCADNQDKINLLHAVLGLSSEVSELMVADRSGDRINAAEELGDLGWYLAIIKRFLSEQKEEYDILAESEIYPYKLTFEDHFNAFGGKLLFHIGLMADELKRVIFYKKPEFNLARLRYHSVECSKALRLMANYLNFDSEEINAMNINKLQGKGRFKDGIFTSDQALNRDTDNERKILEDLA